MAKLTAAEEAIIAQSIPTQSAEMYSNMKEKKKVKVKENTFQQSTRGRSDCVNVGAAPRFSPPSASHSLTEEEQRAKEERDNGITNQIKYGRRLNFQHDKIVELHLQTTYISKGKRYSRTKAYLSIKTETDSRYMIFMRSCLTTAVDETFRSIKKDFDADLTKVASEIYSEKSNNELYFGRVKYKPPRNHKIQDFHRKNLPKTLLAMWLEEDVYHAIFYLVDDYYHFILDEEITGRQKQFYQLQGTWRLDEPQLSIDEAFNG